MGRGIARSSILQPDCTSQESLSKDQFRRWAGRELTGRDKPGGSLSRILQKSNTNHRSGARDGSPGARRETIEVKRLEIAAADFLAGGHLDNGDVETLMLSRTRFFHFLREDQKQALLRPLGQDAAWKRSAQMRHAHDLPHGIRKHGTVKGAAQ